MGRPSSRVQSPPKPPLQQQLIGLTTGCLTKTVLGISVLYLSPIILIEIVFNVQYTGLRNMDLVQKELVHFLTTSSKHFVSHYPDSQPPNPERLGGR